MIDLAPTDAISLRISVTDRCQLRCSYCMPACGVPKRSHSDVLTFEEITAFTRVVKRHFGLSKVHLTGGEPLLRPDVDVLVAMLAELKALDATYTLGHRDDPYRPELRHAIRLPEKPAQEHRCDLLLW